MGHERLRAKIEADVVAGRHGIARDRLRSLLRLEPQDLSTRVTLGEVNWAMGYPVEAGRWWFLVSEPDERQRDCIKQFVDSCDGNVAKILERLALPSQGAGLELEEELENLGARIAEFVTESVDEPRRESPGARTRSDIGCMALVALILIALVNLLVDFLRLFFPF